ncbi:MAG: hypothetical protein FJ130_02495 [Deltaproteobacteria bacterium]|nr:hypothetical protein [Deltaproteobacteria bacterium]
MRPGPRPTQAHRKDTNHPSGELQPSESDLNIHCQLTEAGKILGIQILDHVIVTRKGYYSFRETGLLTIGP